MTHYEVLGVDADASAGEIRRAYLRLVREHHPDALSGASRSVRDDADARIRAVNAAWSVLGHPERRRAYDRSIGGDGRDVFTPFDDDEDEPDPRLAPDVPYEQDAMHPAWRRLATLAPVLLLAGAFAAFSVSLVVGSAAVLGLAVAMLVLAAAMFVAVPLLFMSDARRHG